MKLHITEKIKFERVFAEWKEGKIVVDLDININKFLSNNIDCVIIDMVFEKTSHYDYVNIFYAIKS